MSSKRLYNVSNWRIRWFDWIVIAILIFTYQLIKIMSEKRLEGNNNYQGSFSVWSADVLANTSLSLYLN